MTKTGKRGGGGMRVGSRGDLGVDRTLKSSWRMRAKSLLVFKRMTWLNVGKGRIHASPCSHLFAELTAFWTFTVCQARGQLGRWGTGPCPGARMTLQYQRDKQQRLTWLPPTALDRGRWVTFWNSWVILGTLAKKWWGTEHLFQMSRAVTLGMGGAGRDPWELHTYFWPAPSPLWLGCTAIAENHINPARLRGRHQREPWWGHGYSLNSISSLP